MDEVIKQKQGSGLQTRSLVFAMRTPLTEAGEDCHIYSRPSPVECFVVSVVVRAGQAFLRGIGKIHAGHILKAFTKQFVPNLSHLFSRCF